MRYIGAIDQGTTSTRFVILDEAKNVVSTAQLEHAQILPQAGWVEHDANEIWQSTQQVIQAALRAANLVASDLSAIAITNQRETVVAWDKATGQPLATAIVWQDMRTSDAFARLHEEELGYLTATTGLPISPYFSASKMRWLLDHNQAVATAAQSGRLAFGTIDSWLVYKLSNSALHVTDITNASRTMLMELSSGVWDPKLLKIFGIDESMLPQIRSSAEVYGLTSAEVVGAAIPIASILGDQHAAMVGQLCLKKGDIKCTYGTGNFALVNTGTEIIRSQSGLISTVCFKFGDNPTHYALEGSIAVTGSAVQWLRDQLGIINSSQEVEELAASVTSAEGLYFVPAFSGLYAPHWRSDARGVIIGLTRATTKAHIARATLEAICYQTKEILDVMSADMGQPIKALKVDGGITKNSLCMQLQADTIQVPVMKPANVETTVLGAAYAAGWAIGLWPHFLTESANVDSLTTWQPRLDSELPSVGYQKWRDAVSRTLNLA